MEPAGPHASGLARRVIDEANFANALAHFDPVAARRWFEPELKLLPAALLEEDPAPAGVRLRPVLAWLALFMPEQLPALLAPLAPLAPESRDAAPDDFRVSLRMQAAEVVGLEPAELLRALRGLPVGASRLPVQRRYGWGVEFWLLSTRR